MTFPILLVPTFPWSIGTRCIYVTISQPPLSPCNFYKAPIWIYQKLLFLLEQFPCSSASLMWHRAPLNATTWHTTLVCLYALATRVFYICKLVSNNIAKMGSHHQCRKTILLDVNVAEYTWIFCVTCIAFLEASPAAKITKKGVNRKFRSCFGWQMKQTGILNHKMWYFVINYIVPKNNLW